MASNSISAVETLRQTLGQLQAALNVVDDAIAIFSEANKLIWCNKSFEDFTGASRIILLGKKLEEWIASITLSEESKIVLESFLDKESRISSMDSSCTFAYDYRGVRCTFMLESHYANYKEQQRSVVLVLKNMTDKYKALNLQKRTDLLEKISERCALTGILNRRGLLKRLNYIFSEGKEDGLALVFCDINKFKQVNDTYGHDVGDQVLCRISSLLRQTSRGEDFVGRLAGDEFLVCIVNKSENIESVAAKVIQRISKYLDVKHVFDRGGENIKLEIKMSLGIALGRDAGNVEELIRNADIAMYQAKSIKSASYLFDSRLKFKDAVSDFIRRSSEVHFINGSIPFHLQPIISVKSSEVVGYEVLMRPISSDGVLIPAEQFVKYHEAMGSIESIDSLLVSSLCEELRTELITGDRFISINLSALTLCSDKFPSFFIKSIKNSLIPFRSVIVEITETAYIRSQSALQASVEYLSSYGVRIFLDDFGVGQTGLIQLVNLPIDGFKIDSTLFNSSKKNDKARYLLSGFALFAENLNIVLIVEGIEDEADLIQLNSLHIDMAQGYKFCPPMPQDFFMGILGSSERTLCCPIKHSVQNPFRWSWSMQND